MIDEKDDDCPGEQAWIKCVDCEAETSYENEKGEPMCENCQGRRSKPPVADGHFDGENPYDERRKICR